MKSYFEKIITEVLEQGYSVHLENQVKKIDEEHTVKINWKIDSVGGDNTVEGPETGYDDPQEAIDALCESVTMLRLVNTEEKILPKPDEILQEIKRLENLLEESKKTYMYKKLMWSPDDVGCFDIGKCRAVLKLLSEGRELEYRHEAYPTVKVFMNLQQNRIFVEGGNDELNEDTILNHMLSGGGEWYVKMH